MLRWIFVVVRAEQMASLDMAAYFNVFIRTLVVVTARRSGGRGRIAHRTGGRRCRTGSAQRRVTSRADVGLWRIAARARVRRVEHGLGAL